MQNNLLPKLLLAALLALVLAAAYCGIVETRANKEAVRTLSRATARSAIYAFEAQRWRVNSDNEYRITVTVVNVNGEPYQAEAIISVLDKQGGSNQYRKTYTIDPDTGIVVEE